MSAAGDQPRLRFGRVTVETSNEDKVFFPEEGITKGDLIRYYLTVAERMLPHLKGRPLSFQRFPDGISQQGFFQKDAPKHYPDWIKTVTVPKKGGHNQHVVVDRVATLAYLANNGVLTMHGALSREPDLRKPDRVIFDLDPSVNDFGLIVDGAFAVREVLEDIGLVCFLQTTGSRGVHVVSPIKPDRYFDEVGTFARQVAGLVVSRDPDSFTIEHRKNKRGDRLLIDHFRNQYAQTAVVPYSVRAKPEAPVAMPIEWSELERLPEGARTFTVTNAARRLTGKDPWASMNRRARSLNGPIRRLERF